MSNFVILCDSTADLPKNLRERFNVPEIIKGTVTFPDGHDEEVSCDWDTISSKEFYESLKNKNAKYSTGSPSPEKFSVSMEKYLKQGMDVLVITISSGLSSTYQYALDAANDLNAKYLNNKVVCVDSKRYSTAELLLIIYAYQCQAEGLDIMQTYQKLEEIKNHLHQSGPMDDLMYLARAKRISNGKAIMGSIIGINPIGEVNEEGITKVLCKVKGSKKALNVCVEYIKRTIVDPENQIIVIAHSNREEKALLYKEMIEKEINPKEIIFTEVGLSCAVNVGPGLCAAYYFGKEITKDLVEEQKIFEDIINGN